MAIPMDAALQALLAGMDALAPLDGIKNPQVIFLRAQMASVVHDYDPQKSWHYEQSFAPHALRLKESGFTVTDTLSAAVSGADRVLYLATRFAEENEATLARAWRLVKPGGWLLAALHNDLGGKRLSTMMKQLPAGAGESVSKHHCRAVGVRKPEDYLESAEDKLRLDRWIAEADARLVPGTSLMAAPGMFSWREVDPGSALLVQALPKSLSGRGADIACGWGYLSWAAQQRAPGITQLALIEAEKRALDLAMKHAKPEGSKTELTFHWADATRPLPVSGLDFAIMNPPAHELMQSAADATAAIFARTAQALKQGGVLWLVANRHLPYERTLETLFQSVVPIRDDRGFKVLEARK